MADDELGTIKEQREAAWEWISSHWREFVKHYYPPASGEEGYEEPNRNFQVSWKGFGGRESVIQSAEF